MLAGKLPQRAPALCRKLVIRNRRNIFIITDEIWIADKNEDDSTKLFSLEDEQVRIDKVLDQNYMDNVWGGVPVFENEEEGTIKIKSV